MKTTIYIGQTNWKTLEHTISVEIKFEPGELPAGTYDYGDSPFILHDGDSAVLSYNYNITDELINVTNVPSIYLDIYSKLSNKLIVAGIPEKYINQFTHQFDKIYQKSSANFDKSISFFKGGSDSTWNAPLSSGAAGKSPLSKEEANQLLEKVQAAKTNSVEAKANKLPGIMERVEYPCDCSKDSMAEIKYIIIHLNDAEKWSREQIADWLDELHDSGKINIEF